MTTTERRTALKEFEKVLRALRGELAALRDDALEQESLRSSAFYAGESVALQKMGDALEALQTAADCIAVADCLCYVGQISRGYPKYLLMQGADPCPRKKTAGKDRQS